MTAADPDTRGKILDAAKEVLLEHGTSGARMQDIADAAEVNKALLHYYFQNKDNLSGAVFQRELSRLMRPVLKTLGSNRPLEEKVRTAIDLYLAKLSAFPLMPGYVLAEMHFHPERLEALLTSVADVAPQEMGRKVFTVLGRQIDVAVAAGRMRPISPHQFLVNLVSLCVFPFAARPLLVLMTGGNDRFDAMIDERRETLTDFFLGALRP